MRKIQDKKNADTAASATSATSSVNEVARLKEREAVSAEVCCSVCEVLGEVVCAFVYICASVCVSEYVGRLI